MKWRDSKRTKTKYNILKETTESLLKDIFLLPIQYMIIHTKQHKTKLIQGYPVSAVLGITRFQSPLTEACESAWFSPHRTGGVSLRYSGFFPKDHTKHILQ